MTAGPDPQDRAELDGLVGRGLERDKHSVARLVSVFEDQRAAAPARRAHVLGRLSEAGRTHGAVIGLTGTPGSGKSTLMSRLTTDLLRGDDALSIAVIAVDPSSQVSGGALLGDRTRMRFRPDERRLFFRSQAAGTDLGGLGPSTFQVCRLLARLFDAVMIETVGIGQSEADIRHLADRVYLVLQPLGGDEVQFLKAGIIEVPDAFVLNKCDEPSAAASYHHLRSSMWLARPFDEEAPDIFRTSALTGQGMVELERDVAGRVRSAHGSGLIEREPYFLRRWVDEEWGRAGTRFLDEGLGGPERLVADAGGYDAAQEAFGPAMVDAVRGADRAT